MDSDRPGRRSPEPTTCALFAIDTVALPMWLKQIGAASVGTSHRGAFLAVLLRYV